MECLGTRGEAAFWSGRTAEARRMYPQALDSYRKGAGLGNARSQFRLGRMYFNGVGVRPGSLAGRRVVSQSRGRRGRRSANRRSGVLYERGEVVEQSFSQAVAWYRKAAARQQPEALYNLGAACEHGRGVTANAAEAARWYEKAARLGCRASPGRAGRPVPSGQGVVPRDMVRAHAWLQLAVRNDHPEASKQLAALRLSPEQMLQAARLARQWAQAEPER